MSKPTPKPRKKPQFVHLHPTQAAKAKQAWVNKVKVRSQWAKQKRKVAGTDTDQHMEVDGEPTEQSAGEPEEEREEPIVASSRKRKRPPPSEERVPRSKPPTNHPSDQLEETERRERLRDLSRKAYAPESLHNFRSDPLHRQRGGDSRFGNTRGRGQPNMKLRMNALLEKIKLDAGVS